MRHLTFFVIALAAVEAASRPLDGVPQRGASAADFAPGGWSVEATLQADLDGVAPDDLVIVLLGPGSVDQSRALVWAHALEGGGFTRIDSNVGLLACMNCMGVKGGSGAPDLSVSKRVLTVTSMGGSRESYSATHRFRFEQGLVRLIGVDHWDGDSLSGEGRSRSENLLTGVTVVETQPATEDEAGKPTGLKATKKTTRAKPKPPVALHEVREYGSEDVPHAP
ncbi:MAG: hypothetical protein SFW67_37365 [Myxococcaceae bacterium]|nr:hypothetical protein [Myxococcaceae bacterium]